MSTVVALFYGHRRRKRRSATAARRRPTVAEDLAASMADAIDDLEAEPDARRAVIAAYARMEGVLARHGLRRRPSETPLEYLRRILLGLTARADAVSRLTSLFEQAKFSRHEIDGAMKHDAIGALREIRDDLREASSVRRHLLDLIILFVVTSIDRRLRRRSRSPACGTSTLHAYVFVVGGLLMLGVVAAAGDAVPRRHRSEFDRGARRVGRASEKQLPEVEKLEREVTLATASAYDLHFRLLPHLREIAQARLERAGRTPGPETLGRWWELLRPDRQPPEDRFAQGHLRDRTARSRRRPCEDVSDGDGPGRSRPALEPRPRRGREGRRRQARRARAAACSGCSPTATS